MTTVFIIDDHPVSIAGVKSMLKKKEISVTGEASGVDEFLGKAGDCDFQVILLDLYLPGAQPVENLKKIRTHFPGKPVVIFTSEERESWLRKMIRLGINGYVTKNSSTDELAFTLKKAAAGEYCIVGKFNPCDFDNSRETEKCLTVNQIEILSMITKGRSQEEIAKTKQTTVSNVEKTLRNIRLKLKLETTVQVIKFCIERGYL